MVYIFERYTSDNFPVLNCKWNLSPKQTNFEANLGKGFIRYSDLQNELPWLQHNLNLFIVS